MLTDSGAARKPVLEAASRSRDNEKRRPHAV